MICLDMSVSYTKEKNISYSIYNHTYDDTLIICF
jgi:hypothetical protein